MGSEVHGYRFGRYELRPATRELRRDGIPVRLAPQPAQFLELLLQRAGQLVTREEIRGHLWPDGTWVDFEQGINHAVRRIRTVLRDDPASARWVETVPRAGYRFVGDVRSLGPPLPGATRSAADRPRVWLPWVAAASLLVAGLSVAFVRIAPEPAPRGDEIRLRQLTRQGSLWDAAVSPDGLYMAYALHEEGGFAIRLAAIDASRDLRIVGPVDTPLRGLSFSPGGDTLYFSRQQTRGPGYSTLKRVSALGGPVTDVASDADSGAALSPDGRRLAFVRGFPFEKRSALVVADLDGHGQRELAV